MSRRVVPRRFLVCIHDATPACARETRVMIQDLAPVLGRRLSFAAVPDWHGEWPLTSHPDYCRLIRESSEEVLLHGFFHRRQRGRGPITLLTGGCDEMNGLDLEETRRTLERGQRVFADVFGEPARGFLAPGWQAGQVRSVTAPAVGLEYVAGFFALEAAGRAAIPLATWSWDCGRWGWLGHAGHGVGSLLQSRDRVPVLAMHPRDIDRGFWPSIMRRTRQLIDAGFEPSTPSALLQERDVHVVA